MLLIINDDTGTDCSGVHRVIGAFAAAWLIATGALGTESALGQTQPDEPTDPPYELCANAASMGRIALPYDLEDQLEGDDESTRVDFYRFEAEPGLELRANLTGQWAFEEISMRNPLLGLFDSECNRLDYNDDLVIGSDVYPDARLDIEVPEDGVFILAAAASPDTEFDGSSDDTGSYSLRINLAPWAMPLEPPKTTVERAADGRIDVHLFGASTGGYNIYRDGRYVTTVRLSRERSHFRLDGIAGSYCIVAFEEHERRDRYSVCGDAFAIGDDGLLVGPPSAPQELRGVVHSAGVAELFWRAAIDDGDVVAYRIRRDDVELESVLNFSRYDTGLEPDRTYRYAVSAIDDAGLEGPPAYLDIRPMAAAEVPPMTEFGESPEPPGSMTGRLYSLGVVEIFWQRSADHASVVGYEVSRDGARVAFHRGISHFEPRLSTQVDHLWSVSAVGANGVRSAPRRLRLVNGLFVELDPRPSDALIRRESYVELVGQAFDLFVGDLYNAPILALRDLPDRMSDIRVSRDTSGNPILDVYDCSDGRAELALTYSGTNYGEEYDWRFDACEHQGLRYDGTLFLHDSARGERYETAGMSITLNDDNATTVSGAAQWFRSQTAFFDDIGSWDTDALALSARTHDGVLDLSESTSHFSYGYQYGGAFRARMAGSLAVRSDRTDDRLLLVSTPVEFLYERVPDEPDDPGTAWNFTSGQLELVAEDGSRVLVDADTGNASTVRVTIDNERGPDTFVANWRPWQARLRFDRYPEDAP